jgi:carboxylesterase type B
LSVFVPHHKAAIGKVFAASTRSSLASKPTQASSLLAAYGISDTTEEEIAYRAVLEFGNDINFLAPALAYAKGWSSKAYVYHINEPNPWEGPWKGTSNHCFDIALLFQNYEEFLSPQGKVVGLELSKSVIRFVNGQPSWQPYTLEQPVTMVFGGRLTDSLHESSVEAPSLSNAGRRSTLFQYEEHFHLKTRINAWRAFVSGH